MKKVYAWVLLVALGGSALLIAPRGCSPDPVRVAEQLSRSSSVTELTRMLEYPGPLPEQVVREAAAVRLGEIGAGNRDAISALESALKRDPVFDVRVKAARALSAINPASLDRIHQTDRWGTSDLAISAARSSVPDDPPPVGNVAERPTRLSPESSDRDGLPGYADSAPKRTLNDDPAAVSRAATRLLARLGDDWADPRGDDVIASVSRLGPAAVPAIREVLYDKSQYRRVVAARALARIGPPAADAVPDLLAAVLAHQDEESKDEPIEHAKALSEIKPEPWGKIIGQWKATQAAKGTGEGFDLWFRPGLDRTSEIPTKGKDLIVVAGCRSDDRDNGLRDPLDFEAAIGRLHFRVFDGDGKVVVDTDETKLPEKSRQIEVLRKELVRYRDLSERLAGRVSKKDIINSIVSILDHDTRTLNETRREQQRQLPAQEVRGSIIWEAKDALRKQDPKLAVRAISGALASCKYSGGISDLTLVPILEDMARAAGTAGSDEPTFFALLKVYHRTGYSGTLQWALREVAPKDPSATPRLLETLEDVSGSGFAIDALADMVPPPITKLIEALGDGKKGPRTRWGAARVLGRIGPKAGPAIPALIKALRDEDHFSVPRSALPPSPHHTVVGDGIDVDVNGGAIPAKAPDSREAVDGGEAVVGDAASLALGRLGASAVPGLVNVVQNDSESPRIRRRAILALGDLGRSAKEAIGPLREARRDRDASVREAAESALKAIATD